MSTETYTPLTDEQLAYLAGQFGKLPQAAAAEIRALRATAADLLYALKEDERMMEMLWKAVPWGRTSRLDVALLDNTERTRKAAIARAEGRGESGKSIKQLYADEVAAAERRAEG